MLIGFGLPSRAGPVAPHAWIILISWGNRGANWNEHGGALGRDEGEVEKTHCGKLDPFKYDYRIQEKTAQSAQTGYNLRPRLPQAKWTYLIVWLVGANAVDSGKLSN